MEIHRGIRRVRLKGFPQSVCFSAMNSTVYILTVTHGARNLEQVLAGRTLNRNL